MLNKILVSVGIIIVLSIIRFILLRLVWRNTQNVKVRYQWKQTLSIVIPFIALVLIGAVWMRAFAQFGAFMGLLTAGLAIALKDPLTNMAGWFFIVIRKPFSVGDRIQVGNYAGDVVDIRMFQFSIIEIGNWVDADQSTGRIIHLPNSKVFLEAQANYNAGFNYIWNEIPVLITFESNWEKAKVILNEVAYQFAGEVGKLAEKEILKASRTFMIYYTHLTPIVYIRVEDSGVKLTIRYLCNPRRRRGTETEIWEEILKRFQQHPDVELAYPTTRFYSAGEKNKLPSE